MKIKSVSALTVFVQDLKKSVKFYEMLGLEARKTEADHVTLYSNWFSVDLVSLTDTDRPEYTALVKPGSTGSGLFVYMAVDDVDAAYQELVTKKVKPVNEPHNQGSAGLLIQGLAASLFCRSGRAMDPAFLFRTQAAVRLRRPNS